jgi:hypothetical protein
MQNKRLLPRLNVWTYVKKILLVMLDLNGFVLNFLFDNFYIKRPMAHDTIFEMLNFM